MPPRANSFRSRVTLRRLADEVGVHASTVSRALDPAKRHLVADSVAERIVSIAQRLGYRPNPVAAGLRTSRSKLVGVLMPDITNPVYSLIISGIIESAGAKGYSTIVADAGPDVARQLMLVDELIARRVDGLALATVSRNDPVLAHCIQEGVPVVVVNRVDDSDSAPAVAPDEAAGMRLVVNHLAAIGHRRIGHIAGPATLSTGYFRRAGFETAMAAHNLKVPGNAIVEARAFDLEEGEAATRRLLGSEPRITAITAANDILALGAYRALGALGLKCPASISVVGYNDMPFVDIAEPPLTTVRIDARDMGRKAAHLLIGRMNGESIDRRTIVRPTLIERGSTASPTM